jgi:hypothetical protein
MSRSCTWVAVWAGLAGFALAQSGANSDAGYQALRNPKLGNEALTLDHLKLTRDAGVFTLTGTLCFVAPVEGRVTGAVFSGTGEFSMQPPTLAEQTNLSRLTKQPRIDEQFERLVLRFTDATYDELKHASGATPAQTACNADLLSDVGNALYKELKWNLAARLLQDVYGSQPGGLFAAFIRGKKYDGRELFLIDPQGSPEEVRFETWNENRAGVWAAFRSASAYAGGRTSGRENGPALRMEKQQIDLSIDKSGRLQGKATTTFVPYWPGLRVVHFDLYPTLRVESVLDSASKAVAFIQEDKDHDAEF